MALNALVPHLTPFLIRKDGLFTYEEVLLIINEGYGFTSFKAYKYKLAFKHLLKYFEMRGIETPTQAWLLYENEQKQGDGVDVFKTLYPYASYKKAFEIYLTLLMACSSIPIDRDFISEVYINNNRHGIIWFLLEDYYHLTKPDGFPNLDELESLANRR